MSPDSSQKPTATVITSTRPRGGKDVKLVIIFARNQYRPSLEKKFFTWTSAMLAGLMNVTLKKLKISDNTAVIMNNHMKRIAGCGSLSQNFSIRNSMFSSFDVLVFKCESSPRLFLIAIY